MFRAGRVAEAHFCGRIVILCKPHSNHVYLIRGPCKKKKTIDFLSRPVWSEYELTFILLVMNAMELRLTLCVNGLSECPKATTKIRKWLKARKQTNSFPKIPWIAANIKKNRFCIHSWAYCGRCRHENLSRMNRIWKGNWKQRRWKQYIQYMWILGEYLYKLGRYIACRCLVANSERDNTVVWHVW